MSAGGGTKAVLAAMIANFGIAIAKLIAFFISGATSMLAEAVHSFADTGNLGLLLLGGKRAVRDASDSHQFGYGRERYFWSFIVAMVLFTLGSAYAIYEGINKIRHPHEVDNLVVPIVVLLLGIMLEGWSFRTAVKAANPLRAGRSWKSFIQRSKAPELPVVLLEDAGALIGLVIALVFVVLAKLTGNAKFDGVGTLSIGVLLGAIAIVLAIEMKSLLIGESANVEEQEKLVAAIEGSPYVEQLLHIQTQHLGPAELLVGAKVAFNEGMSTRELADAINDLEMRIRAEVPIADPLYIEPDLFRENYEPYEAPEHTEHGDGDH
jgi:cation diffusion facilitator family transporter